MIKNFCRILALLSIGFIACSKHGEERVNLKTYLFLGHPYDWRSENRIDTRIEALALDTFDGIWLGGDVCARSSKADETLIYLDSLFDLDGDNTHWALGNHDIMEGDQKQILNYTKRPEFYVDWQDDLCLLVLNTNYFWHHEWTGPQENCDRRADQLRFIENVCDTLSLAASHLIVLHHHGLFNDKKTSTSGDTLLLNNINPMRIQTHCDPLSDFSAEFYDRFAAVQSRGIQVVLVSGDVGMVSKGYDIETPAGIRLLGSGINNSLDKDYVPDYVTNLNPDTILIFEHYPAKRQLNWLFLPLDSLNYSQGVSN